MSQVLIDQLKARIKELEEANAQAGINALYRTAELCATAVAVKYDSLTKEELIQTIRNLPEEAEKLMKTRMNN